LPTNFPTKTFAIGCDSMLLQHQSCREEWSVAFVCVEVCSINSRQSIAALSIEAMLPSFRRKHLVVSSSWPKSAKSSPECAQLDAGCTDIQPCQFLFVCGPGSIEATTSWLSVRIRSFTSRLSRTLSSLNSVSKTISSVSEVEYYVSVSNVVRRAGTN
jgi:hypothetical protein